MPSKTFKPSIPLRGYRAVLMAIYQRGRDAELIPDLRATYSRKDFRRAYDRGRQDARVAVLRQYGLGGVM